MAWPEEVFLHQHEGGRAGQIWRHVSWTLFNTLAFGASKVLKILREEFLLSFRTSDMRSSCRDATLRHLLRYHQIVPVGSLLSRARVP